MGNIGTGTTDTSPLEAVEPQYTAPALPDGAMVPLENAVAYYEVAYSGPVQAPAVADTRKHAGLASQRILDSKRPKVENGITYYPSPLDVFKKEEIIKAITSLLLLRRGIDRKSIGPVTFEQLYQSAELISVEGRTALMQPGGRIRGLLQALQSTLVSIKTPDSESAEVADRRVEKHGFLGQYVFTGASEHVTASVVHRSPSIDHFLYWNKDVFDKLSDSAKMAIGLETLGSSPLLTVGRDISDQVGDLELTDYPIIAGTDTVPSELVGLNIVEEGDAFKAHQLKVFRNGGEIEPIASCLGLILKGKVAVIVKDREGNLRKIAEIGQGHTVFEANAAGTPPKGVRLVAEEHNARILFVYLSEDDPNCLSLIRGALKGQAIKLNEANLHQARMRQLLRGAGVRSVSI